MTPKPVRRTPTPPGGAGAAAGSERAWSKVKSFAYQLQNLDIDQVAASKFDLLITDYSFDGTETRRLTPEQVRRLQTGPNGRRLVMAYVSIGEAEDYRYYWNRAWQPGNPPWLDRENPDWKGNYAVRFWNPDWQRLIYGSPNAYIDKIIDAGFDGIFLDQVDIFEYWERQFPLAALEMARFVREISIYVHIERGLGDFGVFPQNGERLVEVPGYMGALTGIAREDVYYGNPRPDEASPARFTAEIEQRLDLAVKAGLNVLTIDYTQRPEQVADAYRRSRDRGYIPYATVRDLDRLIINRGLDPA